MAVIRWKVIFEGQGGYMQDDSESVATPGKPQQYKGF